MGNSRSHEFVLELFATNGHIYVANGYPSIHIYVADADAAAFTARTLGGRVLVHRSTHDVVVSKRTLFLDAIKVLELAIAPPTLKEQLKLLTEYAECGDYTERLLISARIDVLNAKKQ